MKALIMAAGVGTRLEPLTLAVPKPMITILNIPIMQYNIELLSKYGISDVTANLHYFPEQIQNSFPGINYSYEEELLGTAGGVLRMARVIADIDDTFLVLSADALTNIDISGLIAFHKSKKSLATIALKEEDDVTHFGVVILDGDKRIKSFQEKPEKGKELSRLVNTGIYVFEPEILDMIPARTFYDFGRQLFPEIIAQKLPFFGYESNSYWCDVGTIPKYKQANFDFGKGNIIVGKNVKISKSALIEDGSIIGNNCIIRDNARVSGSIIWSDTIIDESVIVGGSIIGSWCYLEQGVVVERDCVVANRCRVKTGRKLFKNTILKPDEIV